MMMIQEQRNVNLTLIILVIIKRRRHSEDNDLGIQNRNFIGDYIIQVTKEEGDDDNLDSIDLYRTSCTDEN